MMLVISCSTTKNTAEKQTADSYDATPIAVNKTAVQKPLTQKQIDKALAAADPVEIGESSLFQYNMLNTDVDQCDAYYSYYPKYDEIAVRLSGIQIKAYLMFDKNARSIIRNSIAMYEKDFTDHVLARKGDRYDAYGDFQADFYWGLLGPTNQTKPKTSVGYKFVKNSPYFILTMWPADGIYHVDAEKESVSGSTKMTYFFNRKQANDLLNYLDEDKITEIVNNIKAKTPQGDLY